MFFGGLKVGLEVGRGDTFCGEHIGPPQISSKYVQGTKKILKKIFGDDFRYTPAKIQDGVQNSAKNQFFQNKF